MIPSPSHTAHHWAQFQLCGSSHALLQVLAAAASYFVFPSAYASSSLASFCWSRSCGGCENQGGWWKLMMPAKACVDHSLRRQRCGWDCRFGSVGGGFDYYETFAEKAVCCFEWALVFAACFVVVDEQQISFELSPQWHSAVVLQPWSAAINGLCLTPCVQDEDASLQPFCPLWVQEPCAVGSKLCWLRAWGAPHMWAVIFGP
mmetsp:Transcript_3836/g.8131  ORF Transcript_3836/g.8131 Transcript_3836/m.8131 type:complete len:203 (+) Transcript_3836:2516-3124(+)